MADDPASTRSNARSTQGLSHELESVQTRRLPNPSRGGSRGYPLYLQTVTLNTLIVTNSEQMTADAVRCSRRTI